eukprot:jgi/Psemu1/4655/gm1.4655_g
MAVYALNNGWLSGYPKLVNFIFDQGTSFMSNDFQIHLEMHGTIKSAMRTELNTNPPQTLQEAINILVDSVFLTSAQFAVRSTINKTFEMTPGSIVFHCDMFLPIPVIIDLAMEPELELESESEKSMPSTKPIQTPVFCAAQLHGTYFKYEDRKERDRDSIFQLDLFQVASVNSSLGTNDNDNDNDDTNNRKLFPSLTKIMVKRSNKLNKGYICLKWHLATKAQRAQEVVKQIDPGYGWKIKAVRDPTANQPPSPPAPEKIEGADLLNTLDWPTASDATTQSANFDCGFTGLQHVKRGGIHSMSQGSSQGIYMQLMTNHCPEWVDDIPTCAINFALMEFPIFARDTKDMEASPAGPDIQLA